MVLGPAGDPELEGCRRGAGPGDTLDAVALARRFPGLRPRAGDVALWDCSGGVLRADRALRAVQVGATVGTGTGDRVGVPISVPAATSRCPHPGRVSPARGHAARRGEGAEHPARCCAHRHHHRRGVPSPPAHHRGRSLDQCPAGTAGAAPAAAGEGWWHRAAARPWARLTRCPPPSAPAHRRVLLEGEGARQPQRRHGHPLLHGAGAARGSPRHLRAARPRVPRAGQGERGTVVGAPRFPPRLSPLSGRPQVCYHHGSPVDPEDRDRAPPGAPHPNVALLSSFISSYLPGLEPQPAVLETCMYTVRPRCPLCPRPRGQETPPVPSLCPWGAAPSPACSPCDPTEHPRWRLHPGPAPQAQQHRHRGRLLG